MDWSDIHVQASESLSCGYHLHTGNDAQALKLGLDAAMEEERESQRSAERIERRRWKADQKQALDKMLPKATGR